jgi:hypothetical protein
VLAQAYAEVDRMLPGDTVPDYDTIMKLDVIPRVLEETLRLWAPIPMIGKAPLEDTVIGGRYELKKGTRVNIIESALHPRPKAWERPLEFDIDRWRPENRTTHHPHAYKPFGNGQRACIGRQFALTEARLALVLQKFRISDPGDYHMDVREALTRKPFGFHVMVRPRQERERTVFGVSDVQTDDTQQQAAVSSVGVNWVSGRWRPPSTCFATSSDRWPGWCGCTSCARCGPAWASWPRRVTRWRCRPGWPARCSPRRRRFWGLYFVDDHFVPYEGAKPVGKGYNTKRRHAQKGLADTLVTDYHGRAACFVSGPPSGLTTTLPAALAQLRQVTGDAKIMLGFDRGGSYPSVFTHCRD